MTSKGPANGGDGLGKGAGSGAKMLAAFNFDRLRSVFRRSKAKERARHEAGSEAPRTHSSLIPLSHLKSMVNGRRFTLQDFDLRSTVGLGTLGRVRVVKIRRSPDRTPMALKIMKKSEVIRLQQVEHVKSEIAILGNIAHPFVTSLLAAFQDDTRLFMLLEFVNGGELFNYMRTQVCLPDADSKFYAGEIVLAFGHLHSMNIVYRDLKPENLLIDCEGHIKLTDFGFAKEVEDRTWTVCGTAEYLAPEIVRCKCHAPGPVQSSGHGRAVDWWALGILIFEMLAGYPPFSDTTPFGIYQKVLAGRIKFPKLISLQAKDLIKRLLTIDHAKRLGCLANGVRDVQMHKWFKSTDWDELFERGISPPFIPPVKAPDDISMFDRYPESSEESTSAIPLKDQKLFQDFEFNQAR